MPIRNENVEPGPITIEAFKRYLEHNGTEKAQGFFDAIVEISKYTESIMLEPLGMNDGYFFRTPNRVRTKLKEFNVEQRQLIEQVQSNKLLYTKKIKEPS